MPSTGTLEEPTLNTPQIHILSMEEDEFASDNENVSILIWVGARNGDNNYTHLRGARNVANSFRSQYIDTGFAKLYFRVDMIRNLKMSYKYQIFFERVDKAYIIANYCHWFNTIEEMLYFRSCCIVTGSIKGAQSIFSTLFFFSFFWRLWYHKKSHILLIVHGKLYR